MTFAVEEVHPVADKAAIRFQITLTLAGDATMYIRGVEVFTITDDGPHQRGGGLLGRRGRDLRLTTVLPDAGPAAEPVGRRPRRSRLRRTQGGDPTR